MRAAPGRFSRFVEPRATGKRRRGGREGWGGVARGLVRLHRQSFFPRARSTPLQSACWTNGAGRGTTHLRLPDGRGVVGEHDELGLAGPERFQGRLVAQSVLNERHFGRATRRWSEKSAHGAATLRYRSCLAQLRMGEAQAFAVCKRAPIRVPPTVLLLAQRRKERLLSPCHS